MRAALVEAHEAPARELESIGERLARKVGEIGQSANAALSGSSDQFAIAIERASADGVARLTGAGGEAARAIADSAAAAAAQLIAEAERLDEFGADARRKPSSRSSAAATTTSAAASPNRASASPRRSAARASASSSSSKPPPIPPPKRSPPTAARSSPGSRNPARRWRATSPNRAINWSAGCRKAAAARPRCCAPRRRRPPRMSRNRMTRSRARSTPSPNP